MSNPPTKSDGPTDIESRPMFVLSYRPRQIDAKTNQSSTGQGRFSLAFRPKGGNDQVPQASSLPAVLQSAERNTAGKRQRSPVPVEDEHLASESSSSSDEDDENPKARRKRIKLEGNTILQGPAKSSTRPTAAKPACGRFANPFASLSRREMLVSFESSKTCMPSFRPVYNPTLFGTFKSAALHGTHTAAPVPIKTIPRPKPHICEGCSEIVQEYAYRCTTCLAHDRCGDCWATEDHDPSHEFKLVVSSSEVTSDQAVAFEMQAELNKREPCRARKTVAEGESDVPDSIAKGLSEILAKTHRMRLQRADSVAVRQTRLQVQKRFALRNAKTPAQRECVHMLFVAKGLSDPDTVRGPNSRITKPAPHCGRRLVHGLVDRTRTVKNAKKVEHVVRMLGETCGDGGVKGCMVARGADVLVEQGK